MSRQIYAFRMVDDPDGRWYGEPDVLPEGRYATMTTTLEPGQNPSPFVGKHLELRHGELPDDDQLSPLRSYTNVDFDGMPGRAYMRRSVAEVLFPGHN
jgi:hypothetical protein